MLLGAKQQRDGARVATMDSPSFQQSCGCHNNLAVSSRVAQTWANWPPESFKHTNVQQMYSMQSSIEAGALRYLMSPRANLNDYRRTPALINMRLVILSYAVFV